MMGAHRLWIVSSLALLSAFGCAHRPAPVETPVPLAESFTQTGDAHAPSTWWEALEDDDLNALVTEALDGNFSLAQLRARLDQARAVAKRDGAGLYPAIDGNVSTSKTYSELDATSSRAVRVDSTDFTAGLSASWEIDLWGRARAARDAARRDVVASQLDLQAGQVSLSAEVALTWARLAERKAVAALLERQVEINRQLAELLELRFKRGRAGIADVLRQKQLVESTRAEGLRAQADVRTQAHRLAVLLGRSPIGARFDTPTMATPPPALPATGVPSALLDRRPDVRRARARVEAADLRVVVARADRYPRLTLTGSGRFTAEDIENLLDNWIATLGAQLAAPLFDGGRRRAEVDRTRAVLDERLGAYGEAVLVALQEVEDALFGERQQRALVGSVERQLELAESVVSRLRDAYRNGAVDYLDVLNALLSQQSLERAQLTAARELLERRIELHRALAGAVFEDAPVVEPVDTTRTAHSVSLEDEP